jgi:enediyne biosynthesis protein E5
MNHFSPTAKGLAPNYLHTRSRLMPLYSFGILMVLWNLAGHGFLGFEQSYAAVVIALGTAIPLHYGGLWLAAWTENRPPPWKLNSSRPALRRFFDELPAAIIPGFACAMLLYSGEALWPIVFAVSASFASKALFRVPIRRKDGTTGTQHIFNPSNFGILLTLVLMPSVGLAPPYQFTADVGLWAGYTLPLAIFFLGLTIHLLWTNRWNVILAWFVGFAIQGIVRGLMGWWSSGAVFEKLPGALQVPLLPYTGTAFMLFSFFMIPDPATTPSRIRDQWIFGGAIAAIYGVLQQNGIVYGFFWGLIITCAVRGVWLATRSRSPVRPLLEAPAT